MSRQLTCDICGTTDTANLGMRRNAKPPGWAWLSIVVKQPGLGEGRRNTYDLCPTCTTKVVAVLP